MNDIEQINWWMNYQQAALTRLRAATDPGERAALRDIAFTCRDAIVSIGRLQQRRRELEAERGVAVLA